MNAAYFTVFPATQRFGLRRARLRALTGLARPAGQTSLFPLFYRRCAI